MITVPKWDKRNNQQKIDEPFYRLLDTNNRMTESNAESNWMIPKTRKVVKKRNFPLVLDDEKNKKCYYWKRVKRMTKMIN